MRKRKPPPPDTRPDWRDQNLKIWIAHLRRWVTPEQMQASAQRGVNSLYTPDWRNDPTYNLRRRKP